MSDTDRLAWLLEHHGSYDVFQVEGGTWTIHGAAHDYYPTGIEGHPTANSAIDAAIEMGDKFGVTQ